MICCDHKYIVPTYAFCTFSEFLFSFLIALVMHKTNFDIVDLSNWIVVPRPSYKMHFLSKIVLRSFEKPNKIFPIHRCIDEWRGKSFPSIMIDYPPRQLLLNIVNSVSFNFSRMAASSRALPFEAHLARSFKSTRRGRL